jgi:hypothetical protein
MFLPSDQTNLPWPCGLQLLEQSKATAIRMSRFCLHGLFRDVLLWSPHDFTAYHCLLNSRGKIFDHIKNAEKTIPAFKGFQKVPFRNRLRKGYIDFE